MERIWIGRGAIPFIVGCHVDRQVPQAQLPAQPPSTGVDYLGLVVAAHDEEDGRRTHARLIMAAARMPAPHAGNVGPSSTESTDVIARRAQSSV